MLQHSINLLITCLCSVFLNSTFQKSGTSIVLLPFTSQKTGHQSKTTDLHHYYVYTMYVYMHYCTVCKSGEVEDECHFIHDCKPLEQFRQDFFGTALQHQPGFSAMSATEKMVYLFESDNVHIIKKLAWYIYCSLHHRQQLLFHV